MQSEIDKILTELKYEVGSVPRTSGQYVAWAFLFAIETAMRRGEILSIRRANIFKDHIHLADTKNGEERDVPPNSPQMANLLMQAQKLATTGGANSAKD